ncbi:MAG TPA: hypothetical protein VGO47_02495, partial [Chlamydiales bacterium]|nr:hypothetical protein [Chlamydiales bacterium]
MEEQGARLLQRENLNRCITAFEAQIAELADDLGNNKNKRQHPLFITLGAYRLLGPLDKAECLQSVPDWLFVLKSKSIVETVYQA